MKLRACLYIAGLALFCTHQGRAPSPPKAPAPSTAAIPLPVRNPVLASKITVATRPQAREDTARRPSRIRSPETAAEHAAAERIAAPKLDAQADREQDVASIPPLPRRKPEDLGPVHPRDVETPDWTDEEIATAAAQCQALLKNLPIKYQMQSPLREGECGTPAPILVTSIGQNPAVDIGPAALMTCPLAAALATWFKDSVQPAARKHLGAPIARISNISSYVCRTRYNEAGARISQHAFANALDVALFQTASGEKITVLGHWHAKVESPPPLPKRAPSAPAASQMEAAALRQVSEDTGPRRGRGRSAYITKSERVQPASQKGEPQSLDLTNGKIPPAPPAKPDPKAAFLHEAHDKACANFGTVLGPEANAAHANHFHLDMAARRHKSYCE